VCRKTVRRREIAQDKAASTANNVEQNYEAICGCANFSLKPVRASKDVFTGLFFAGTVGREIKKWARQSYSIESFLCNDIDSLFPTPFFLDKFD
jgi:hypothetical protein